MSTTATAPPFTLEYVKTIGMISNVARGRGFLVPYAMARSSDGRFFVVDRNLIRITICNFDEDYLGEFATWYGEGEGDQKFQAPSDMVFDGRERLYVADEAKDKVFVYTTDGGFVGEWGEHGSGDGELNGACSIAFDSADNAYVVDQHNHRVQVFTTEGEYQRQWGDFGGGEGQFNMPWGVTVDSRDNVYVADWRNDRIQKFTTDGSFVASFGESGRGDGQLDRPSVVVVDADGYMYIADWGNHRVQVLDPDGAFVQKLRGQATLTKWTEDFFESNVDERDTRAIADLYSPLPEHLQDPNNESSQIEPYFWGLTSLILDDEERLYVLEHRRHRFQIYRKVPAG